MVCFVLDKTVSGKIGILYISFFSVEAYKVKDISMHLGKADSIGSGHGVPCSMLSRALKEEQSSMKNIFLSCLL